MFHKLKPSIKQKFHPGRHQLYHLYDHIMKHFGVDGIEGEEIAQLVMHRLHEEGFLKIEPNMFYSDMFVMPGTIYKEGDFDDN